MVDYRIKTDNGNQDAYYYYNLYKMKKINKILYILATSIFILGLGILFIKILINDATKGVYNKYYKFGYGGGELALNFLIICVLLIFLILRNKKGVITLILSILYLFYSLTTTGVTLIQGAKQDSKKNKLAFTEIANIERDYIEGKDISTIKLDSKVYGRLTPYLVLIKNYYIDEKKSEDNLTKQIAALDLENMSSDDVFGDENNMKNVQQKIKDFDKMLDDYKQKEINEHKNTKKRISKLMIPIKFKQGALRGFSESQIEIEQDTDNMISIEKDTLSKLNSIMEFMLSIQGNYKLENGQILFCSSFDLSKFKNYGEDLEKLIKQGDDAEKQIDDNNKQSLSKMDKYINEDSNLFDFFWGVF